MSDLQTILLDAIKGFGIHSEPKLSDSLVYSTIFKWLAYIKLKWQPVCPGAFTTTFLLMTGKFGISLYVGNNNNNTITLYGAANSVIIL